MKRKYVYLYLLGLLLFSVACTGNFRDYNTDLSGITDDDLIIDDNGYGIRLGIIQQGIYFNYDYGKGKNWPFQLIQNLNADMFSGYMHDGKPLNGGSHNSDYNMQDGWNSAMWTHMYSYIFPQIYQSENATRDRMPAFFGITKILKVEVMHRVTDYYGPIVYSHFADPEAAWNAAFTLNDGGVAFLRRQLRPVCDPAIKRRQVADRVADNLRPFVEHLRRFHRIDDKAALREQQRQLGMRLARSLALTAQNQRFGELLRAMLMRDHELYALYYQVENRLMRENEQAPVPQPSVGSAASAIELTCDQLERCCGTNFVSWVDVCKGWQEETNG